LSAAAEAESERHRMAIQDLETKIAEMSEELEMKGEAEKNLHDCVDQIRDELNTADETLKKLRTYNGILSRMVHVSQSEDIGFDELSKLYSNLPTKVDTSNLHTKVFQLTQILSTSKQI
jgi:chromosome segregation ATPase